MWTGYLEVGGIEVLNSERAIQYAETSQCAARWLQMPDDEKVGLRQALGDGSYAYADIEDAPWYDTRDPATAQFLGIFGLDFDTISDSTAYADVTEAVGDGGIVGRERFASRRIRVTAWLTALSAEALEAGHSWLKAALRRDACGSHGDACGITDAQLFVAHPRPQAGAETTPVYTARVNTLRRELHGVARVSGPLTITNVRRGNTWGRQVEFTLTTAPHLYKMPRAINIPPSAPVLIQDIPFNLVPYPSAELIGSALNVGRNLSQNPSVEVNATGYTAAVSTISGTSAAAYFTSGRATDIAAESAASFRGRILGNGSTAVSGQADVVLTHSVALSGLASNTRMSFTVWGGAIAFAGPVDPVVSLSAKAEFYTAGSAFISSQDLGTAAADKRDGNVFSVPSVLVPSTAASVRIIVTARVNWSSSSVPANNSDVRVYMDAVGASIP